VNKALGTKEGRGGVRSKAFEGTLGHYHWCLVLTTLGCRGQQGEEEDQGAERDLCVCVERFLKEEAGERGGEKEDVNEDEDERRKCRMGNGADERWEREELREGGGARKSGKIYTCC
jgi:hypothetical protein